MHRGVKMTENKDIMLSIVKKIMQRVTGRNVDNMQDANLLSLLDSLEFVSLVVELETILEIEFEEHKLTANAFATLDDFLTYLLNKKANGAEVDKS